MIETQANWRVLTAPVLAEETDIYNSTECFKGGWSIFFCWHVKNFFLLHCVPLYVCRLCIKYQDLRTNLLGMAALRILLLTFISHFVIDFLSI